MAKQTRAERRRERAQQELAGKGWTAIFFGILLLVVAPAFLKGPIVGALGPALRPAGWLALAIGAVLLGLHYIVRRQTTTWRSSPLQLALPHDPRPPSVASPRNRQRHLRQ